MVPTLGVPGREHLSKGCSLPRGPLLTGAGRPARYLPGAAAAAIVY
jgi:hypothetical protein